MRNTLIATVSAFALLASGAVSAAELKTNTEMKTNAQTEVQPGVDSNTNVGTGVKVEENVDAEAAVKDAAKDTADAVENAADATADTAEDAAEGAADMARDAADEVEKTGNDTQLEAGVDHNTNVGTGVQGGDMGADNSMGYRSYSSLDSDFAGEISGGYSADELIGTAIVGPDGDEVAEVSDLLIGADDKVDAVLVDVGGFLGIGEKQVALQIEQLNVQQGAEGQFSVNMSKDEIEALPAYTRADTGMWQQTIVK